MFIFVAHAGSGSPRADHFRAGTYLETHEGHVIKQTATINLSATATVVRESGWEV